MIIFSHIPKTAGTSLKFILRCNFGIHHVDTRHIKRAVFTGKDLAFAKKVFPGIEAISGHNLADPARNINEPGAQLITVLREPVVRCASHYQDNVLREKLKASFDAWIRNPENQNVICKNLTGSDDVARAKVLLKENYHFVGITEHFQESLKLLQHKLDRPLAFFNKKRIVASSNKIKEGLLREKNSLALLEKYNLLDQEIYDFALKEIFLPTLQDHREALENIQVPSVEFNQTYANRRTSSIRYNKYIYRPLIKFLKA